MSDQLLNLIDDIKALLYLGMTDMSIATELHCTKALVSGVRVKWRAQQLAEQSNEEKQLLNG